MSTTKETRPIDANNLAQRIREYMDDFPNATTRLATCRAILSMLGDETQTPTLRPVTREQVEKVWKGRLECKPRCGLCAHIFECDKYGKPYVCESCVDFSNFESDQQFCEVCGAPMTDKAVDMVMERLEVLHGKEENG